MARPFASDGGFANFSAADSLIRFLPLPGRIRSTFGRDSAVWRGGFISFPKLPRVFCVMPICFPFTNFHPECLHLLVISSEKKKEPSGHFL